MDTHYPDWKRGCSYAYANANADTDCNFHVDCSAKPIGLSFNPWSFELIVGG